MPCCPANAAMEAPGCWQALTNSALNSGVYVRCVRRAGYLGVSDSLSMVCTICCVHTILRVGRAQFKMDSPDAYEALPIARAIEMQLEHDKVFVKIWTDGVFRASKYPIESLEDQLDESDFAIAIAQPDDSVTTARGVTKDTPRDNVIFELGLFVGRLGRLRSILLEPRGEVVHLPSDLSGLTTIGYRTDRDPTSNVSTACNRLRELFNELGPR